MLLTKPRSDYIKAIEENTEDGTDNQQTLPAPADSSRGQFGYIDQPIKPGF